MLYLLSIFFLIFPLIPCLSFEDFPVSYKGRFRPAEAYAKLWLYDATHSSSIKTEEGTIIKPIDFLFLMEKEGITPFQDLPLFWITDLQLKKNLGLPKKANYISYQRLRHGLKDNPILQAQENFQHLNYYILHFDLLKKHFLKEKSFKKRAEELIKNSTDPQRISLILENEFPLKERLKNAGIFFKSLPSKFETTEWYPLRGLLLETYDPETNQLKLIDNFTSYSSDSFKEIQQAYKEWLENNKDKENFTNPLLKAYENLAGKNYLEVYNKTLHYPSLMQLKIESIYLSYPWVWLLIGCYSLSILTLFYSYSLSFFILSSALFLHTFLLGIRSYILERPPVSNMFETLFYVPWLTVSVALFIPSFRKNKITLLAASIISVFLLFLIQITDLNQSLDQVQAVLDSQFWLIIHVLLVVGSYGLFLLAAVLAHFYLISFVKKEKNNNYLPKVILNILYTGTIMLIAGTILGGIWAAQSWGRFWDWDPKESWAFVSSCLYLLIIHSYRFNKIGVFGLAVGAILGAIAISFTWYGVNYLIGTGLHSYGFGNGGLFYYSIFLFLEFLFIAFIFLINNKKSNKIED